MYNFIKRMSAICLSILITSCTHYLYSGNFDAIDSKNKKSSYQLYWTKSDSIISKPKAGPAVLKNCTQSYTFVEQDGGIVYEASKNLVCGKFKGLSRFIDFESTYIEIYSTCALVSDVSDEFDLIDRTFLKQRSDPYRVEIQEESKFGFRTSGSIEPPDLQCGQ